MHKRVQGSSACQSSARNTWLCCQLAAQHTCSSMRAYVHFLKKGKNSISSFWATAVARMRGQATEHKVRGTPPSSLIRRRCCSPEVPRLPTHTGSSAGAFNMASKGLPQLTSVSAIKAAVLRYLYTTASVLVSLHSHLAHICTQASCLGLACWHGCHRQKSLVLLTIVVVNVEQCTHGATSHVGFEPADPLLHVLLWCCKQATCNSTRANTAYHTNRAWNHTGYSCLISVLHQQ